ncbi:MAG TPA: transcription elongation factor GreA [Candidatus Gracilibacteria bacterium]
MAKKDDQQTTKKVLLTKEGLKKLEEELEQLKTVSRKEVAARLAEAISYGDLSENSEYVEAKDQQAFVEGRILEIEDQIKSAEIISGGEKSSSGTIQIGSTVTLKFQKDTNEYTIVGSTEADPLGHKISNESPVGSAILGKKVKDKVIVKAPAGDLEYEVVKIA